MSQETKVIEKHDVVIRFSGDSGDGMQLTGQQFSDTAALFGNDVACAYIFVVRADSIAERRMVELGPEVGNNVIIERGLVPHENIVVEGFHKLTHGDKVIPSTYRAEQEDHSKN